MGHYRRRRKDLPVSEAFWLWLIRAFAMPALLATPVRAPGNLPASRLDKTACEKLRPFGLRTDDNDRIRVSGGRSLPDLLRRRLGNAAFPPDGVLYPRHEADVQALLTLCAGLDIAVVPVAGEDGVTVTPGAHKALVALDLSGLSRILSHDPISGLMDVEAGIGGAELQRQLDALGLSLGQSFDTSLGGWIASSDVLPAPVQSLRLATPQGTLALGSGLKHVLAASRARLGIITSAKLRVRPAAEGEDCRAYLFRDFAAGLAVLRQAARAGIALGPVRLSDDGASHFERAMQRRPWNLGQRLFDAWLVLRDFDNGVARLIVSFPGSAGQRKLARQSFEALAKKIGALKLGKTQVPPPYPRDAFLDHGVGIDRLELAANWSELPLYYARLRSGLKQAMRAHPPVTGAHGLVLAHVSDVRSEGALLTVTWLFPRKLEEEVSQATSIRQTALALTVRKTAQGLELEMRRAIKRTVDPKNVLPPEA
jgi:alkyldihydroxyacetonephosphate synthase